VKPNFTVENEAAISAPPKVDFNKPGPAPAPATSAAPKADAKATTTDPAADPLKKGY
jgi:LemA protein